MAIYAHMPCDGHRKVTVRHIEPGSDAPGDCDYWFDQIHDRSFMTFVDAYPGRGATASLAHKPRDGPRVTVFHQ